MPVRNVGDHVARHAAHRPDAPALHFGDTRWTYRDLDAQAARAANAFMGLGVAACDRIALHLDNCPAFVVAYLGAVRMGAIPVSIPTPWRPGAVAAALRDAAPRLIVTTPALHERIASTPEAPDVQSLFVSDLQATDVFPGLSLERALSCARDCAPLKRTNGSDPAAILYTSGTTSAPKGVVLSHANIAINAHLKARYCGMREDDRVALVVPLFHCYGQNAVMNAVFHAGAAVVLARRFDAATLAEQASTGAVTVVFGVPSMFTRLLDLGDTAARGLGSLRFALSAATTLPAAIASRWREATGVAMREAYGLTESSPFAAYNHVAGHVAGTLGAPIDGVEMDVVDPESGVHCTPGDCGEIVMRGHNVMLGYWARPAETARALRDGWLHTGDLGYADEQGCLHLVNRVADLVKVSGFRVYPAIVEAALRRHPQVRDAAAFGVTHATHGERVEAAVVTAPDGHASAEEIQRYSAPLLAKYERPARLHFCRELPRSPTGKVSREVLRAAVSNALGFQQALDAELTPTE